MANQITIGARLKDQISGPLGAIKGKFAELKKAGSGSILTGVGLAAGVAAFQAVGAAAQRAISGITDFIGGSISAASDLNETLSKSNVVFGESARAVEDWGATAAQAFGQSKRQALDAASGYGALFDTIGIVGEQSADMSMRLTELGSDLASFYNTDVTEALDALKSGLIGEAEPMRRFGALLSEARVKAFAYANGIAEVGKELTDAQKVQARYGIILQDTTVAQGDFARTSDGLANSQRQLAADFENLQAEIGQALLPVMLELVRIARESVIPGIRSLAENFDKIVALAGTFAVMITSKLVPVLLTRLAPALSAAAFGLTSMVNQMERANRSAVGFGAAARGIVAGLRSLASFVVPVAIFVLIEKLLELRSVQEGIAAETEAMTDRIRAALDDRKLGLDGLERLRQELLATKEALSINEGDFLSKLLRDFLAGGAYEEVVRQLKLVEAQMRILEASGYATWGAYITATQNAALAVDENLGPMEVTVAGFAVRTGEAVGGLAPKFESAERDIRDSLRKIVQDIEDTRAILTGDMDKLATALYDPIAIAADLAIAKSDLSNEKLKRNTEDLTKVEQAESDKRIANLEADILRREVELSTYGTWEEQLLRTRALTNSPLWTADLKAAGPEAQALREQWRIDTENHLYDLQRIVYAQNQEVGRQASAGLRASIPNIKTALVTVTGVVIADWEKLKGKAWTWGGNIADAWVENMKRHIRNARNQIISAAEAAMAGIRGFSPPKVGPLRDIDRWGENVGRAWAEGFTSGIADAGQAAASAVEGGLARLTPPAPALAAVGVPGLGAAGTTIGSITINIDGARYSDEQDLGRAIVTHLRTATVWR